MSRRFVFLAILLAVALAVPTLAQAQKPDFSGKWIQDMEKSDQPQAGRAGGGGGGGRGPAGPQEITITQTATEIKIERVTGQGTTATIYKLDGTESTNAGRGGDVKSKTIWEGNKLVTKYQRTMGETTVDVTETRSLADGFLTVETKSGENTVERLQFPILRRAHPLEPHAPGGCHDVAQIGRCPLPRGIPRRTAREPGAFLLGQRPISLADVAGRDSIPARPRDSGGSPTASGCGILRLPPSTAVNGSFVLAAEDGLNHEKTHNYAYSAGGGCRLGRCLLPLRAG
jgi:hypothetical protein